MNGPEAQPSRHDSARTPRPARVRALAGTTAFVAALAAILGVWSALAPAGNGPGRGMAHATPVRPHLPAVAARAPVTAPSPADEWSIPVSYRASLLRNRVRYFPEKLLALTFDDGPDAANTPRVLKALAEHHARATFFVQGNHAVRHPELLRAIVAGGNAIGNHSYSHPVRCSPAQAEMELSRTEGIIEGAVGRRPALFRPPFGIVRGSLAHAALAQGYTVVLWTVSSADTRPIEPEVIAKNVIHTPNPGDIVIMHDGPGHGRTAEALPRILDELGKAGFRFVTIPELTRAWSEWKPARTAMVSPTRRTRR